MPAETTTALFCADYFSTFEVPSSTSDRVYEVTFSGIDAYCLCPGFKHRRQCRHVDRVFKQGCFWNPQWYDGGTRELRPREGSLITPGLSDEPCPVCGGPTVPVRIAV